MDIRINCKKEEQEKITSKKEFADSILDRISGIEDMSDEDRSKMDARIMSKLEAGDKLSKKELDYLKRTNPIMYAHVMRVQRTAESVKERLKHARSKEEANRDKTNNSHKAEFFENEKDNDGLSLMNWSPLTEEYDRMPTFSVGA